jgi:integrase
MPVLTTVAIAALKPRHRRYEVRDTRSSLRLIVFPSGKKSWVIRYRRRDGRSAKLTLGTVNTITETEGAPVIGGPLTLAAARKLAAEIDLDRASGRDPAARKRTPDAPVTFGAGACAFIKEHASRKTRRWHNTARLLGFDPDGAIRPKSLADRWRDRPISDIGGNDVHALVVEARNHGVPGLKRRSASPTDQQAREMHATLHRLFSWMIAQRTIAVNPATGVHKPKPPPPRERVLSDDEIRALWTACDELRSGAFADAIKVMLITGARRDEVGRMHRDELTNDNRLWTLPASRSKNRREHAVPMPSLAREIIAARPVDHEHVFSFNSRAPVTGWADAKRRIDARMPGVKPWRIHDLRRTAVTGMARAGADLHVIERAINHVSGSFGGIVGVYQKHRYADQVAAALEAWSNLLRDIIGQAPTNVVELRRG